MNRQGQTLGGKVLEVNGAGCKKRFMHSLKIGNLIIVVDKKEGACAADARRNYQKGINYNWITVSRQSTDSNHPTASAVVETIDRLAECVGLIDTNYFPKQKYENKGSVRLNQDALYKCAIVQEVNRQLLFETVGLSKMAAKTEIDPADIVATCNHFGLPPIIKKKAEIAKDIEFVKSHYIPERLDVWINGWDKVSERYVNPDVKIAEEREKTTFDIPVYQYGRKVSSFKTIHTIDGDYIMRLPVILRDKIQAWYNADSKNCMKVLKKKFSRVFVLKGEDLQGEKSDWTAFKKSLCNGKKENIDIDYSDVEKYIDDYLDMYETRLMKRSYT